MNDVNQNTKDLLTEAVKSLVQGEGVSQNYRTAVEQYALFLVGRPISLETLSEFKDALEESGFKPSTVTLKVKAIKSMIRKAMALDGSMSQVEQYRLEQALNNIKCTKVKATAETIRQKCLSHGQVHALLQNCTDKKALSVMKVILTTACRISEVLQLTHEGLNAPDAEGMRTQEGIIAKGNKTISISISSELYEEIREAWGTEEGRLFDCERLAITNRITRAVQKTIGVHVTPHSLRHTFATLAVENGLPLQEVSNWLNHASSDTTARYYLHGKRSEQGRQFARNLIAV